MAVVSIGGMLLPCLAAIAVVVSRWQHVDGCGWRDCHASRRTPHGGRYERLAEAARNDVGSIVAAADEYGWVLSIGWLT